MFDKSEYYNLSHRFQVIRKSGVPVRFENMKAFARWSRENGYRYGMTLVRIDESGDWSPENCKWVDKPFSAEHQVARASMVKQWDDFTAPIREYIRKHAPQEQPKVEFFRYEHPDLEREGIVWGAK